MSGENASKPNENDSSQTDDPDNALGTIMQISMMAFAAELRDILVTKNTSEILSYLSEKITVESNCAQCIEMKKNPGQHVLRKNEIHVDHHRFNALAHTIIQSRTMKKLRRAAKRRTQGADGERYQLLLEHFLRGRTKASWIRLE